jgi:hypothetical protein
MKERLGCVSAAGIAAAALVLLGVLGWSLAAGPVAFSPGALSSATKGTTYGGVSSHAQLASNCGACHSAPWSSQTMADRCLACHSEVVAELNGRTGLHSRLLSTLSTVTCKGCHTDHQGALAQTTLRDPATFPHYLTPFSLRGHERSSALTPMTCEDCHPKSLTEFDQATCADCHAQINGDFVTRHEASFGKKCLLCHNGKGRDAANFDHNSLPFKLTGKHVGVACEKCHPAGTLTGAASTPRDCVACHAKDDKHNGSFGRQCDQCHSPNGWAGATFDHSAFPVDHGSRGQQTACTTCHPNGVATYTCYGCHEHTVAGIAAGHRNQTPAQLADCIGCHRGGRGEGGG